jgi:hypothetical protein
VFLVGDVSRTIIIIHPYTCRFRRGVVAVVIMMIDYDDVEVTTGMTMRRRS